MPEIRARTATTATAAVTVTEAKTQLSSLLERVTDGEEIVIRRWQQAGGEARFAMTSRLFARRMRGLCADGSG